MKVSPFRLLNEPELGRIASSASQALARWSSAWFGGGAAAEFRASPAENIAKDPGLESDAAPVARMHDEDHWVAILAREDLYRAAAARFAAHVERVPSSRGDLPPLLRGAIDECFGALAGELLAAARPNARVQEAQAISVRSACRRGSGAACLLGELEGKRLAALMSAGVVAELLGKSKAAPKGGLARRFDCIQDRRVELRTVAGGADLGIASLCSIAPGDVIVLDMRIDETFALTAATGATLGSGFLGTSAGSKVLQLVP